MKMGFDLLILLCIMQIFNVQTILNFLLYFDHKATNIQETSHSNYYSNYLLHNLSVHFALTKTLSEASFIHSVLQAKLRKRQHVSIHDIFNTHY